jgi:hypothetical protein
MSKTMTQTTDGHNPRVIMAIAALVVVLFVLTMFAVVQRTSTTSDGAANPANHAMSGARGSGFTHDPYFDSDGNPTIPAVSAEGSGGSSSVSYDYYLDQHAKLVHRLNSGSLH